MADLALRLARLGIDTHQERVVYMRADCHVCRSEGFSAHSRVRIATARSAIIATLNVVHGDLLPQGAAGLSEAAWQGLGAQADDLAHFSHAPAVDSLSAMRAKIYGHALDEAQIRDILSDVAAGRYANVEIAAFLTAVASVGMSLDEVVALTQGMIDVGDQLTWDRDVVADKHCVGGLPGNRTTPIVVAIVAAHGILIPKTSSRAITSPAGTADTMETLTRVDLDLASMRRVVEREGGCLVWGGGVRLSPVDDLLIRVARALDLDSEAQLVASVLSKKAAAGSTLAAATLRDGRAWRKLEAICEAQGGLREPPRAPRRFEVTAAVAGTLRAIDNRGLARAAKLAGAPAAKAAGVLLHTQLGGRVERGDVLFELHAETAGELEYARAYLDAHPGLFRIEDQP